MEPNFYKREEDKEWRKRTDERLNALTTSDLLQNDRLDELDADIARIDGLLEGKSDDRNDNGIKGDIQELAKGLRSLQALMVPDSLGNGGVIARLKALEKKEERETRTLEYRWKFWTAIVLALLSFTGLLIKEWPDIRQYFGEVRMIAAPAPSNHRKRHRKTRPAPIEEETPNGEPQTGD